VTEKRRLLERIYRASSLQTKGGILKTARRSSRVSFARGEKKISTKETRENTFRKEAFGPKKVKRNKETKIGFREESP